jgi:hypothetical protein
MIEFQLAIDIDSPQFLARSQKQNESVEDIAHIFSQSARFYTRDYSEFLRYL